jgi:hypothetical protein
MFRRSLCLTFLAAWLASTTASANFFFYDQPTAATGKFEWDVFDFLGVVGFPGPHAPDVGATGTGTATITATTVGSGFPAPAVTSINNLYAGARIGKYTTSITGAAAAGAQTTVVMQIAALGTINPATLLLGGAAPTEYVDRGVSPGGVNYYWAEWQVAGNSSLTATADGGHPHFSLAGVELAYFNQASVFNALTPPPIPEPSAAALAGAAIAGAAVIRRRRARSLTPRAGTEGR